MTDLSKLSTEDLLSLQKGDLSAVSTAGLQALQAGGVQPTGDAQAVSGQPAAGAPIPAQPAASTPLPDIPEQYRGGKVGLQKIDNSLAQQLKDVPWYEKAVAGMGAAPMQAWQSLRQLSGNAPSERGVRDWRDITETGAGAVGNVAGNLMMLAAPLGAAEKTLRASTHIPKLLKLATVPSVAAAESAVFRPTVEGESRLKEAGKSALMAGAVGTGLKVLGRTASGLAKRSKLGDELMDQGIQPSVAEGSEGAVGRIIGFGEDLLSTLGYKRGHSLANEQAMHKIKEEITPLLEKYGDPITEEISRKSGFFNEARERFMAGYGSLLDNKNVPLPATFRTSVVKKAAAAVPDASDEMVNAFQKRMAQIFSTARGKNQTAGQWKNVLNQISEARREAMATAGTELNAGKLARLYGEADKALMERAIKTKSLTPAELDALKELNNGWAKLKLVEDAALLPRGGTQRLSGKAGERLVSTDDLITASERSAPEAQKLGEKEFFAKITRPMSEVLSRKAARGTVGRQIAYGLGSAAGIGAGAAAGGPLGALVVGAPLLAAGLAGTTKTGASWLMGNTAKQRALAKILRDKVYPRLGTISASMDTDENKE